MKKLIVLSMIGLLSACSSTPSNRVQSIPEAVEASNGDLETGIYNKRNGENVYVQVQSLKSQLLEAEQKNFEQQKQVNYLKLQNQELMNENSTLRMRLGIKSTKETTEIVGWDGNSPIVKKKAVEVQENSLPERKPASLE